MRININLGIWLSFWFMLQSATAAVYINGGDQAATGVMSTNTYSKGTGAANSNTVDHAMYSDTAATAIASSNAVPGSTLASQVSTGAQAYVHTISYSNAVKSTSLGSEGIRQIGALGGYTLEKFIEDTGIRGPALDKTVFTYNLAPLVDLNVAWSGGDVYSPADGYFHLLAGNMVLTDEANNYAYWNSSTPTQVKWTTVRPAVSNNIVLATFTTSFGRIINVDTPESTCDFPLNTRAGAARIAPSLIVDGLEYSAAATNLNAIVMSAGTEYHDMRVPRLHNTQDLRNPTQTVAIATYYHTNTDVWGYSYTNQFPIGLWDSGSTVTVCAATNWYAGLFLSLPGAPQMDYVYPQTAYTSEVDAISGADPILPPGFTPYIPICTKYVFKGNDTSLRTAGTYWVDRRFQIRRPGGTALGATAAAAPSLDLVMLAGSSLGGILPRNAGLPTTGDQLSSKAYVDSTINKINGNKAYVDQVGGSNETAQLASSILPFKTVQAAINACAAVASDATRYTVELSPGVYTENVTMSNYVSLKANDIEGTRISGSLTFPKEFTDILGTEVALLTIATTNTPALILNAGDDEAHMGVRACNLVAAYDNGQTNKSVVLINRGLSEIYGTTHVELDISPTNGSGSARSAQLFEHTTDPANAGLSQFTSFNSSGLIRCSDTNDDVSVLFTHDNTDAACINTLMGTFVNVHLDEVEGVYSNRYMQVHHHDAQGRSLSMGTVTRLYMGLTNNVNVFFGYADGGVTDNVAIIRGNHIRMPIGSTSNIWLGAATGVNDRLRVYDSVYIQNFADQPYPRIYTNAGSAGKFFVNTVTENGDQLFGSAVDFSVVNSTTVTTPATGHLKQYVSPYAGLENMYFKDSTGNTMRNCRDIFYNGYNADTTDMKVGDAVYITLGLSDDNTPKVKKAIASDPTTLPCVGVVAQLGGIATGHVGRIMIMGRLEQGMDTSLFTSGQKIYLSETISGGLTNVPPVGTNVSQIIATAHVIGTNGYLSVRPWAPDLFGGRPVSYFVTNNQAMVTFGSVAANGASITNVDAATLGGYTYEQLIAQQLTYYIWGSVNGPFTNPVSRMAQLASPVGLPVRTNIYTSVTNGQYLGGISINTNESPRLLTKGIVTIHNVLAHTGVPGAASARGTLYIYESDQVTEVASFTNGEILMLAGDGAPTPYEFDISITNDVSIADSNRIMLFRTRLVDGWTGAETITAYSQNGYLSRVTIAAPASGVYVPYSTYNVDRLNWDSAYSWVTGNSGSVTSMYGRTNYWDAASTWQLANSGGVAYALGRTSAWDNAVAIQQANTAGVAYVLSRTNAWDAGAAQALFGSNGVVTLNNSTSYWNTVGIVSNIATFGSNGVVTLNGLTSGWNSASANALFASNGVVSLNNRTSYWNTVGVVSNIATFGSNGVVTLNNSTSYWNTVGIVSNIATFGSNGVITLNGLTSGWNSASANALFASNGVVTLNNTTSYWNTVGIVSNIALFGSNGVVTLSSSTSYWNTVGITSNNATFASNGVITLNGLTSGWNNAAVNALFASNGVVAINGNTNKYQEAYTWVHVNSNDVAALLVPPSRFKASLITNLTFVASTLTKFPMSNIVYNAGTSLFTVASSRWSPNTTNRIIELTGAIETLGVQANNLITMYLFKNGTNYTQLGAFRSPNNAAPFSTTWSYIDTVNTATTDYYEVYVTNSANNVTTTDAGTNNWWAGHAEIN